MRALEMAMSAPWAMLPEAVENLLAIAAREHDPQALEAYRAQRADRGERLGIRDNVAILNIEGPLFKRANLFVSFSGATSYEIVRRDLQAALDDKAVDAIILNIDSPGGEANGCDELASAIYAARGKKPITAYVSGMACSGAYWLAAAADRIVVSDAAMLGSIGVVLGITDRKKADERNGISRLDFVSSQSPGKRPDIETDEGKARVQKMVDDLADVFVSAVAKYRGVSKATVLAEFGRGGVEVGANAVKWKMADQVGQFEATLSGLSARGKTARAARTAAAAVTSPASAYPRLAASAAPAAPIATNVDAPIAAERQIVLAARERMKAFAALNDRTVAPALYAHLRDETNLSAEEAAMILKAVKDDLTPITADRQIDAYLAKKARDGALGLEGHPAYRSSLSGSPGGRTAGGWAAAIRQTSGR